LVLKLIGVRVHVHGGFAKHRPLMLVSNHVSWSDIVVMGSIDELCFIAKNEVKTWPGINYLSRLQRTVFVDRERKRDAGVQADTIAARLLQGDSMVLFAEGTTGNGNSLLGFKSALFGAPQMALAQSGLDQIFIQPVAIAYNTLHGMPLGRYHQTYASWPGDIELLPHLINFVKQGAFDVDVCFGEPLTFHANTKRKEMAQQIEAVVRDDFARLRRLYHKA
jgi:1-acyl-sn-glycerol-3-phosphate acyltransferase